jgi:hypothetical protein
LAEIQISTSLHASAYVRLHKIAFVGGQTNDAAAVHLHYTG